jgi:hypothetical protein
VLGTRRMHASFCVNRPQMAYAGSGQQELESCIFLPWLPSVPAFGSVAAVRAAKRTFCVGG